MIIFCLSTVIRFQIFSSDNFQTGSNGPILLSQSGPMSNGNKGVTSHFRKVENWSFTTRYSILSYPKDPLEWRVLPLCRRYRQHIITPANRVVTNTRILVLYKQVYNEICFSLYKFISSWKSITKFLPKEIFIQTINKLIKCFLNLVLIVRRPCL